MIPSCFNFRTDLHVYKPDIWNIWNNFQYYSANTFINFFNISHYRNFFFVYVTFRNGRGAGETDFNELPPYLKPLEKMWKFWKCHIKCSSGTDNL